jgi:Rrf2 family protein
MLRLSTKSEYGVRAMLEIAKDYNNAPLTIKVISQRQNLSSAYLEQIMNTLRRAGLVESLKGPGGGYVLADKPDNISIGKILRALEGPVALTSCLEPATDNCSQIEGCVARLLWQALGETIEKFLEKISLQDLSSEQFKLSHCSGTCSSEISRLTCSSGNKKTSGKKHNHS